MKEIVLPPLLDQPKILEDCVNTWTVENWRSLGKKEHGPVFEAGGKPWCVAARVQPLPYRRGDVTTS